MTWKSIYTDGILVTLSAMAPSAMGILSLDDAYKYVDPKVLFMSKLLIAAFGAGVGALLHFRNVQYAKYAKDQASEPTVTVTK